MTLKLHCFGESGNSYKAALTLELAGLDWEPVFVDFFRGAARTDAYQNLNIMAEAPVLEQGDFTCRNRVQFNNGWSTRQANWAERLRIDTKCCAGCFLTITRCLRRPGLPVS